MSLVKKMPLVFLLIALCALALAVPMPAHSKEKGAEDVLEFKKKGFFLGGDLAGLVGFADGDVFGAPGKVDFLAGYQINPYVSVAADLWTFWFIAYAAEARAQVNFTPAKISPYAVATAGVVGILTTLDEDEGGGSAFTYSAGLGADFHLWKRGTLFAELKYRGAAAFSGGVNDLAHGLEAGVGLRWTF